MKRSKIALVIGSGGIKAFGAIELTDLIIKEKIPIDLVAACSGGTVPAATYCLRMSTEEAKEKIATFTSSNSFLADKRFICKAFGVPGIPFNPEIGFLQQEPILNAFRKGMGDVQIEDLPIPLIIQATDMLSGEEVRLTHGSLAKAMYASSAFQPVIPPIRHNNSFLFDGMYTNALPCSTALQAGATIIIAISFFDSSHMANKNSLHDVASMFFSKIAEQNRRQHTLTDFMKGEEEILHLSVNYDKKISITDTNFMPYIFAKTKEVVQKNRDNILRAVENALS